MNPFFSYSFKRPVATLMLFLGVMIISLIASSFLPYSLSPIATFPALTIETEYTGVSPEQIERIITRPIEDSVSIVGGIEEIFSTSEEGKSRVQIRFDRNINLDRAAMDIREQVELVIPAFPREVQHPVLMRYDPEDRPVMIISLNSEGMSTNQLREHGDRVVKKAIQTVDGVGEVIVAGGREREIHIATDPARLRVYNISQDTIMSSLQQRNLGASLGEVTDRGGRFPIHLRMRFQDLNEIKDLPVRMTPGKHNVVRVSDIANVEYGHRDRRSAARIDGEERVSVYVHRASDGEVVPLARGVLAELSRLDSGPVQYEVIVNAGDRIIKILGSLFLGGIAGLILVTIYGWISFHSFVNGILLSGSGLAGTVMGGLALYVGGYRLDPMTISGLLLGCSISIFIAYMIIAGFSAPFKSRIQSPSIRIQEMFPSFPFMTLLVVSAFVPVVFAGAELRETYSGLALSAVSSTAGGLMSTIILPVLIQHKSRRTVRAYTGPFQFFVSSKVLLVNQYFRRFRCFTGRAVSRILVHPFSRNRKIHLLGGFLVFAGILSPFFIESDFLTAVPEHTLRGSIEFPAGTAFSTTDDVSREVEGILENANGVERVMSRVEPGQSTIVLELSPYVEIDPDYLEYLQGLVGDLAPAFLHFEGGEDTGVSEMTVEVIGDDLEILDGIIRELAEETGEIANVSSVVLRYKPARPELRFYISPDRLVADQMKPDFVGQAVRFSVHGAVATRFLERDRELDIRIRDMEQYRQSTEDIQGKSITTPTGMSVYLNQIGSFEQDTAPVRIYRKNKRRMLSYSFQYSGISSAEMLGRLETVTDKNLPENYRIETGRDIERIKEAQERITQLVVMAILLFFMVTAAFLESIQRSILILLAIPVPLSFTLLILLIFNVVLTVPVYISLLVALCLMAGMSRYLLNRMDTWKQIMGEENLSLQFALSRMVKHIPVFFTAWITVSLFFLPAATLPGEAFDLFRSFAIVVPLAMFLSLMTLPFMIGASATLVVNTASLRNRIYGLASSIKEILLKKFNI